MIEQIRKYWNEYGMELLVYLAIFAIIVCFIINYSSNGLNGTYTKPNFFTIDDDYEGITIKEKNTSKLEWKTKILLEKIFRRPFIRIRPDFLRNPVTGNNLEIDLYNEELKLGVEVNGNQHYKFTPHFQKNKEAFLNQRYRDEIKKYKCSQQGINLIEIPYKVGEHGLKNYLINQLISYGYIIN